MHSSSDLSRSSRRQFLRGIASSAGAVMALATAAPLRAADVRGGDIRITRIVAFDLHARRNKVAGKNARLDVHGDSAVDPMVRIYTNADGVEGIGVCRASKEKLAELLGRDPGEFLDAKNHRMRSPLGSQTMPLWDLVARMQDKPVCELLGAPPATEPRKVPVYDGSIYFADLLPQYADAWEDRFKREIDMGLELGHRAFKIKIGRGAKWMAREDGDARDVAVVRLIRDHAGKDVLLGVDANNGYDLDGAKRFLDRAGDVNLAFTEEMFPEVVEQCLALKEFFRARKWDTLLADGETQGELDVFKPFIAAKAIDVLQADMNRFGVDGILTEADMGRPQGITVAPHNWGSLLGFYQQLQVGAAIDNFYRAERDPLSSDVLIADGFTIKDGYATLPPTSGFGLRLNEARFAAEAKITFDLKA
ncbi:MAG: enolase C-terminal domain-like protein [Tepidisphaeraceae bacterium]